MGKRIFLWTVRIKIIHYLSWGGSFVASQDVSLDIQNPPVIPDEWVWKEPLKAFSSGDGGSNTDPHVRYDWMSACFGYVLGPFTHTFKTQVPGRM